ncbi:trypsin-like serine peptidase [Porphyromonas crevioricanis]|uniref:trypsin-like serine peptidase n=1 Tax=Porphyromonas crevioricanis TaxID=393921 RepID=UPI00068CCA7B|nr:serine protease [Porphyromonas crevioricanis]
MSKLYRYFFSILLGLAFLSIPRAWGQIERAGMPMGLSEQFFRLRSTGFSDFCVELPPIDSAAIYRQEEAYSSSVLRGAYPFAVGRSLDYSPDNSGRIVQVGDRSVWTLRLKSHGAYSLNVLFGEYQLPPEAELYVYTPFGVKGAYTDQNNNPSGILAVAPLAGDEITIECSWPTNPDKLLPDNMRLKITELNHAYKDLSQLRVHDVGEPWHTLSGLDCAPNVAGHPEVNEQSRSVLLMVVEGRVVCSGALINNTASDGTPYVLTASHCYNRNFAFTGIEGESARIARTTVFFFGFESPLAKSFIRGSEELTLSGAELIAFNEKRDMCLLRITGLPKDREGKDLPIPAAYKPYFAGWNISGTPPAPYTTIHHPLAAVKRYSRSDSPISLKSFNAGKYTWRDVHWHIKQWQIGTTAPGSSGAPLFDGNGLIIGALSGGRSYCPTPYNDFFWALNKSWDTDTGNPLHSLRDKLDKSGSGAIYCQGYDPYAPHPAVRISRVINSLHSDQLEHAAFEGTSISGVGTVYSFPSKVRILGAYAVLAPMKPVKNWGDFKDYNLSIYAGEPGKPKQLVYFNKVKEPQYLRYNANQEEFSPRARTVTDTIDFFIPIETSDGGNYLDLNGNLEIVCGLNTTDMRPMDLPVLRLKTQTTSASAAFHKNSEALWIPATDTESPYQGSYWVDLLVQPIGQEGGLKDPEHVQVRWDGTRALIQLPSSDKQPEMQVRVYNYAGELCYENHYHSQLAVLELGDLFVEGNYILSIHYKKKRLGYQISVSK